MKIDTYCENEKSLWFHFDPASEDEVFPVKIHSFGHLFSSNSDYRLNTKNMAEMNPYRYHSFQYIINGNGYFRYRDGDRNIEQEVSAQHLFLMSHDQEFSFNFTSGNNWEWMWILVEGELADRVVASCTNTSRVWNLALDSEPVMNMKSLIQTVFNEPITTNQMIMYGCEFLLKFKDAVIFNSLPPKDALTQRSKDIVMRNIKHINVEELAKYLGYSTKYFQKYFRNQTGMTPGAFISIQKLDYASMLLKNSSKKLNEIAGLAGFSDASHLCRVFKAHYGCSPKKLRDNSFPYAGSNIL